MRARLDGGAINTRGCSKGQRVRRRRPRAVAHRGEPAVIVVESVRTFLDVREVAGSNPVLVVVEELAAAQLDASKRDPAGGRDARSATRGFEPGTFFLTATRRPLQRRRGPRRPLERRRRVNARASHDFPGDQPTGRRARPSFFSIPVVGSRAVVVILREHGIDESRAAARVLAFRPSSRDVHVDSGKVPARRFFERFSPPVALRRRNRVGDLNLAVPGERARGDERGGERTRDAAGWTVRVQTRSRRTVTRTVTPPVVRVGEESVDVEARPRFASVRARRLTVSDRF